MVFEYYQLYIRVICIIFVDMATLLEEYYSYVEKYEKEYDNIVCLYQCGSFMEVYSCDENVVPIKKISELLNIQVSRRDKKIMEVSKTNFSMCGFPDHALPKFVKILVDNKYTVIILSQVSPPPKPQRSVTAIYSPGTYIPDEISQYSNNLMSIYFDDACSHSIIGISILDLSTAQSKIIEIACNDKKKITPPLDELFRLILLFSPKEIVISGSLINLRFEEIVSYLDISKKCVHNKLKKTNTEFLQLNFQNQFLKKIYTQCGLMSPIEFLGLERHPTALISFLIILQFSYNHNEEIVKNISIPDIIDKDTNLEISFNAIKQLNIDELNEILNKSSTAIGKRYLKDRLYNPYVDPEFMQRSYDSISKMLKDKSYVKVKQHLNNVYDLTRLFRKIQLKLINPCNFNWIIESLENILSLDSPLSINEASKNILIHCRDYLVESECSKYNRDTIQSSFFKKGKFPDVDVLQSNYDLNLNFFGDLVEYLNKMCKDNYFKLESSERDGYYLTITSKRFAEIKTRFEDIEFQHIKLKDLQGRPISSTSSVLKITHDYFKSINLKIVSIKEKLIENVLKRYSEFLEGTELKFGVNFEPIVNFIETTDFSATCAQLAFENKYIRPIISEDDIHTSSFLNVKGLRHPLVEKIQNDIEYISNDIQLGSNGILLYGLNSAGKSTLSKSIGIVTIMAQAGMFVPASSMEFKPYKKIFTRIPNGDNLMAGKSTFVIEISEIRNILKKANEYSLVIGDELASGTESVSAIAIVGAGIIELCKRNSSFIFATHLHELVNVERLKDLQKESRLKVCHLNVVFDERSNKLIYDRKLIDGHGNSLYGLEVMKSLAIGEEFYVLANEIRREILNVKEDLLSTKKSKYNADKIIDNCEICGNNCEEVHHISEQHLADKDGFIGRIHKNSLYNLVCLCKKCHYAIHDKKIIIEGKRMTSNGPELIFQTKESNHDEEEHVKTYFKEGKNVSQILKIMNDSNATSITRYKINKIIKNA